MLTVFSLIAAAILIALTVFQIALILGAPIGKYAWGGKYAVLPKNLRIASCTSIVLYAIFIIFILGKAGVYDLIGNQGILNIGMWSFTAYFFLGIPLNAISHSKPERYLMTPVVTILAISFLIVTLG